MKPTAYPSQRSTQSGSRSRHFAEYLMAVQQPDGGSAWKVWKLLATILPLPIQDITIATTLRLVTLRKDGSAREMMGKNRMNASSPANGKTMTRKNRPSGWKPTHVLPNGPSKGWACR